MQKTEIRKLATAILIIFILSLSHNQSYAQEPISKTAKECIESSKGKYQSYNDCIGLISKECTSHISKYKMTEIECLEKETEFWSSIYNKSLNGLGEILKANIFEFANSHLYQSIDQIQSSLFRLCDYETGRWPLHARLRTIDNFKCVRNALAERAITLHFWEREIRILRGLDND